MSANSSGVARVAVERQEVAGLKRAVRREEKKRRKKEKKIERRRILGKPRGGGREREIS